MRAALLLLALGAGPAAAAAAPKPAASAAVDWLKVYPLAPYHETWTMTLEVKDFDRDFPKVLQALSKEGAKLVVPLQNSVGSPSEGSRQLIYDLDAKQAKAALKALKKIGRYSEPGVRPAGEPLPVAELDEKIGALSRDKQQHGPELSSMPAVSALVDAELSHLVTARAVAEKLETTVTLDLTVMQRRK